MIMVCSLSETVSTMCLTLWEAMKSSVGTFTLIQKGKKAHPILSVGTFAFIQRSEKADLTLSVGTFTLI